MYSYDSLKEKAASRVSQTIDSPIMVFDYFELSDVFIALFIILFFGVVLYSWGTMLILLILFMGIGPVIKRRNERGVYLHWPYRRFGMSLPGLINPKRRRKFSD